MQQQLKKYLLLINYHSNKCTYFISFTHVLTVLLSQIIIRVPVASFINACHVSISICIKELTNVLTWHSP